MIIIDCRNKKIEHCLKAYRQKVERVRQIDQLKDNKYYDKPSVKRRAQKLLAKYRNRNAQF